MKKILFLLCVLLPLLVPAQRKIGLSSIILENSYFPHLDSTWRYIHADDSSMASPGYNDSNWELVYTVLAPDSALEPIHGIYWFRSRIYVHDSMLDKSFALNVTHYGASEIYLDGVLLKTYGKVSPIADSTEYYNPTLTPFVFHFSDTGFHTIAVRYANYRTPGDIQAEDYVPGFSLSISEANEALWLYTLMRMLFLGFFLF